MGSLKPGATYIYEQADGITYAREAGSSPSTRIEIGRSLGRQDLDDQNEWNEIRRAARTNPALQKAVDRVKLLYKLSKSDLQ